MKYKGKKSQSIYKERSKVWGNVGFTWYKADKRFPLVYSKPNPNPGTLSTLGASFP